MNLARPADRIRARALRGRLARCPWAEAGRGTSAAPAPGAAPEQTRAPAGGPPAPGGEPGQAPRETTPGEAI